MWASNGNGKTPVMNSTILTSITSLVLLLAAGNGGGSEKHHQTSSAGGVLSLDAVSSGDTCHTLTAEIFPEMGEAPVLLHRSSTDGGKAWSEAHRVCHGSPPPFSPRRGMDPQIAVWGNTVVAAWTTSGTDRWGSGPIATAFSQDGGVTWMTGPNPADDGLTTGHGFIDLAADPEGRFHLVWLDSRDGSQGLRHTRSLDGGRTWETNRTIKSETCECCSNAIVSGDDGTLAVLFRDRKPRDMMVSLSRDSGETWSEPRVAGAFGWEFEGCPHVGGGLALTSDSVDAFVWTGVAETPGVFHVTADGPENEFTQEPLQMGGTRASHPALAGADDTGLLAAWDEEGTIRYALRSPEDGNWTDPETIPSGSMEARASHPVITVLTGGFLICWTEYESGKDSVLRSRFVPVP